MNRAVVEYNSFAEDNSFKPYQVIPENLEDIEGKIEQIFTVFNILRSQVLNWWRPQILPNSIPAIEESMLNSFSKYLGPNAVKPATRRPSSAPNNTRPI